MNVGKRESDIPEYINEDLFERSIKRGLNLKSVKIDNFNLSWGTRKGENYCSEIYRAEITYTGDGKPYQKLGLIVKAMPYLPIRGPALKPLNVFQKEVDMYTEVLPELSKIANGEIFSAKYFYETKDPVEMIVFEDLNSIGYRVANRLTGMNLDHCLIMMSKLAKYHVATLILQDQKPELLSKFNYGLFQKDKQKCGDILNSIFIKGFETLLSVVETWTGYENILAKLRVLNENFMHRILHQLFQSEVNIRVLTHGDLWVNNSLFKYDENDKPIDIVFIDYQMCMLNSLGLDINYFLYTSPTMEVRQYYIEDILRIYYSNFEQAIDDYKLESLKPKPTLDDLKSEIFKFIFYGFLAAVGVLPIALLDKNSSKGSDMETIINEEQAAWLRKALYTNPPYQKAMKWLLKRFDELNVLEDNFSIV